MIKTVCQNKFSEDRKLDEMSHQLTWKERTCNWQTFNSRQTTEVHLCLGLCEVKD